MKSIEDPNAAKWLAEAVKEKMVRDVELQLRAIAAPEFDRIIRRAAVAATKTLSAELAMEKNLRDDKFVVMIQFNNVELKLDQEPS